MGNYIFLALVLASFFGLSKLFTKAGIESWKGWIPVYNFYILSKLLGKPWWWCLIMIVPGVNILMYGVYGFNVARAFNKPSNNDLLFASILPYIFFVKLGFDDTAKFVGLDKFKIEPSKLIKNWIDPIVFAVIAASIIRGYFIEAFTIPTSSLEKSLMVGDFLFVNKFAYGPKIPQTPLAFPFAHHTLPLSETKKSYLEWIKLPYFRLPGFGSVKNDDIVVFNYPDGDTVALKQQNQSYYQIVRRYAEDELKRDPTQSKNAAYRQAWEYVNSSPSQFGDIVARPVDKREHYVKRCVGIAGDKLEVRNSDVYINDVMQKMPAKAQHFYYVRCTNQARAFLSSPVELDRLDINAGEAFNAAESKDSVVYALNMPVDVVEQVKKIPGVVSITKKIEPAGARESSIFPHDPAYAWNNDNFGPLLIPKSGLTLPIDTHNICLYEKILNTYDDGIHQVIKQGAQVFYDGKPITSYTFKQDYYFMMGDNRHNSADSRSWGMVPYDHVVGSPFFVWFSMKYAENNPVSGKSVMGSLFKNSKEGKFRWERFLCYVDDGNLHSIKIPFIVTILLIWGLNKWNNRRKLKLQKSSIK
ncbi:MAG: S26 family signal peptidase [Bacteroidetes bacterium]|nr:S26 family signal peptidase [Bacteroidota bacterium]